MKMSQGLGFFRRTRFLTGPKLGFKVRNVAMSEGFGLEVKSVAMSQGFGFKVKNVAMSQGFA